MKLILQAVLLGALSAVPALASENMEAADACIDALRATGTPDAQGGEILSSEFSEAGTLVMLRDLGGSEYKCIVWSDGSVGELSLVDAMDDGGGAMAGAPAAEVLTAPNTDQRVQFAPGTSGATLTATLSSGAAVNYLLGASEGQFLSVNMQASAPNTFFMISVPGGDILYESAQAGNAYRGQLYVSGDHTVQVFYNGNDGTTSTTTLDIAIE